MGTYLLQSYLDDHWHLHPEKPALIDDRSAVTYEMLHRESNRIANCLISNGVERHDRVLICLGRSSLVIVTILGILKADAVYVPVGNKTPAERLARILDDCQPSAIICEESQLRVLDALKNRLTGVRLLLVMGPGNDSIEAVNIRSVYWGDGGSCAVTAPRYRNIDADAAYILYTSGSTGSPKGVIVSHLNVINYIEWSVDFFNIGKEDRILNTAPFHFDMSTFDVFATIKSGATLCIAPDRCLVFPQKLMDLIEKEGITLWKGVSSLLMYMSTTGCLKKDRISSLRKVLFGGEVLPTKHLMNWMKSYPSKQYYNVYGPTEATGISACYPVEKIPETADETIPIGKACANTELFVLTEEGRLAGVGETGELCIRGSGLSPGYWNDEEKTARVFIRNPLNRTALHDRVYRTGDLARRREDGLIEYLGRKDFQIKYLGYRIEIFEIEQALLSLDTIHHAAVVLCNSQRGEMAEMVAFVESPEEIVSEAVMKGLNRLLPNYMIPGRIIQLTKIPVTDRGKTDRNLLQHYFQWGGQVPEKGGLREGAHA